MNPCHLMLCSSILLLNCQLANKCLYGNFHKNLFCVLTLEAQEMLFTLPLLLDIHSAQWHITGCEKSCFKNIHLAFLIHHFSNIFDHGTLLFFKLKPTNTIAQLQCKHHKQVFHRIHFGNTTLLLREQPYASTAVFCLSFLLWLKERKGESWGEKAEEKEEERREKERKRKVLCI